VSFGNPLFLWGALAALLPLLIHLFDRRRPRPHAFAAISFVLRSQKRTASRLKLKRLILYLLRTLILLAIPLALAKPQWKQDAIAQATARGPAATALVLDASLSMRFTLDGKNLFENGRQQAREALRDLLPEEPATVLLCGQNPSPPAAPGFDRARLRTQLDDAQPSYGPADMTRCLELAAHSLEESPVGGKRLIVVSDLTSNAFRLDVPPPLVNGPKGEKIRPEVVLRDAAHGAKVLPNRAIVDLKVEPSTSAGPRAFQFTLTVRNFSPEPVKDLEASLKLGERVVTKGFLDLAPNGTAQKALTYRFEGSGPISGEVALSPDALGEDDRRAFVVNVPKELKALVINGAPNAVRYRDESFFVDAALDAPGSPVRQTVRDVDAGLRENFDNFDVVLLLNVAVPSPEEAGRLTSFVQKGGGLFISVGDHVDADGYNQRLRELLPRPLRLVKTSAAREEADAETKAARLAQVAQEHPIFVPFTGRAREGLMASRFYQYMLLESESGGGTLRNGAGSEVLATYEDGAPAVAVAHKGKGRVLLFTSTVDRDWSDFAIRTSFLPLMQRFCAYLTGSLDEHEEVRSRVGDTLTLRPEGQQEVSAVKSPSGAQVTLQKQADGTVRVGPMMEPGLHQAFDASGQSLGALAFPVVMDPSESDLSRLKSDELATYFGEETMKASVGEGQAPRIPLWTWLIVAAAIAFFFEGLLLRK